MDRRCTCKQFGILDDANKEIFFLRLITIDIRDYSAWPVEKQFFCIFVGVGGGGGLELHKCGKYLAVCCRFWL